MSVCGKEEINLQGRYVGSYCGSEVQIQGYLFLEINKLLQFLKIKSLYNVSLNRCDALTMTLIKKQS